MTLDLSECGLGAHVYFFDSSIFAIKWSSIACGSKPGRDSLSLRETKMAYRRTGAGVVFEALPRFCFLTSSVQEIRAV